MGTIQHGDTLIYTCTVGENVFTSEKSEDDAWRKAMIWQYEQGIKTLEELEFEYGLYNSRDIVHIPNIKSNSTNFTLNSTSSDGVKVHLEW